MSWAIDPKSGDYVMTDGKPTDSDSLIYPAYYRLRIGRKRWMYAPDDSYGSDLAQLKKRFNGKDLTGVKNVEERALKPMIDDGRALAIDVTYDTQQQSERSNVQTSVLITSADGTTEVISLPPIGD